MKDAVKDIALGGGGERPVNGRCETHFPGQLKYVGVVYTPEGRKYVQGTRRDAVAFIERNHREGVVELYAQAPSPSGLGPNMLRLEYKAVPMNYFDT